MFDLFRFWFGAALRILRDRRGLMLENLTLRQQLAVLKRKHPRPRLGPLDKLFWVLVRRLWSQWKEALFLVQPEAVVRWHRAGFKLYWAMLCKVRKRVGGGRRISKPICDLIFQMVAENPSWGAASHPWRTSHARLRGIGNHHLTLDETGTQESSTHEALAGLSAQSPRGDCRDGLLHGTDAHLQRTLLLFHHQPRPSSHLALQYQSASHEQLDCSAATRGLPLRCGPQVPGIRSRREVRVRSAQRYSLAEDHTCAHLDWKPMAEWSG